MVSMSKSVFVWMFWFFFISVFETKTKLDEPLTIVKYKTHKKLIEMQNGPFEATNIWKIEN